MKKEYRRYKQGETAKIRKKLNPTSKKILNDFIKLCSVNAGEKKVIKIERHIIQLFDITEKQLDKLTKEDIIDFMILLNNCDRTSETRNEIKIYIRKFLKWYYEDLKMIECITVCEKDRGKINDKKINENTLITEKEFELMLRQAENFREKCLLSLLWETGCRPEELLNLKWKDIKFNEGIADITLHSNKTNRTRVYPVKEATIHLKRWKQEYCFNDLTFNDYLFPTPLDRKKPIGSPALNKMVRKFCKKAGIEKNVWNYLWRHTKATRLYESLPTPIVEKLLGHTDMYKVYAHISNKKAREELLKSMNIKELTEEEKTKLEKRIDALEKLIKKISTPSEDIYDIQGEYNKIKLK